MKEVKTVQTILLVAFVMLGILSCTHKNTQEQTLQLSNKLAKDNFSIERNIHILNQNS